MIPQKDLILNILTPKIKLAYSDIKLVSESEYCQTFDAISKADNSQYTIRTLNIASGLYKENPSLATTLFVQELLRLSANFPGAVIVESFESHERGQFACVIKHCRNLEQLIMKGQREVAKEVDCDLLLKDVLSDVKFLLSNVRIAEMINIEL